MMESRESVLTASPPAQVNRRRRIKKGLHASLLLTGKEVTMKTTTFYLAVSGLRGTQ